MPENAVRGKGGISRRKLLARGAVAAGVVWAAPVIRTTSAYASASDGTERPATRFFCVAIDASNQIWPVFPDGLADLPPTWHPESLGNGWPAPWDGEGEPPWAKASVGPKRNRVFTYDPPEVIAGPGSSVSFGRAAAVDPLLDDETIADETIDDETIDDETIADDNPEMPDSEQFAQRIGADLPDPLPPPIIDWVYANPGIELESPDSRPALTQVGDSAWACLLPAPPSLPDWWSRRYRLVLGCYKDGNHFGRDGYEDPDPPQSQLGRRVIFPTRIERVGGYAGRSGRPGRAGPDHVNVGDDSSSRAATPGSPGSARRFAEGDPEPPDEPRPPDEPGDPEEPSSTPTSTTTTTRPATEPPWDPATCTPDPTAPFPWNLKFPDNFVVAWVGPRFGLQIPKPPKSACLPPRPPGEEEEEEEQEEGSKGGKGGKGTASNSTTSTTTTTAEPESEPSSETTTRSTEAGATPATPAPAAAPPQEPSSAIRHEKPRSKSSPRVRYSHRGHLGDHECIVLIYCRP